MKRGLAVAAMSIMALASNCGSPGACPGDYVTAFGVALSVADGPLPPSLNIHLYWNSSLQASPTLEQLGLFCWIRSPADGGTGGGGDSVVCAWGDAGTGRFEATATGYQPVDIELEAALSDDGCHPDPVSTEVTMQPR